jgi:hypothetical protein
MIIKRAIVIRGKFCTNSHFWASKITPMNFAIVNNLIMQLGPNSLRCTKNLVTLSPKYSFFVYIYIFPHHQHGHKVDDIDVFRYRVVYVILFINVYGNQNIG